MFLSNYKYIIFLFTFLLTGCFSDQASQTIEHTDNAISITLSHDGAYVLIAYSQGHVELRHSKSNEVVTKWRHDDSPKAGVIAADFSKNNELVVTAEQGNMALFSLTENKVLYFWSLDDIRDIKLSSDGEYALVSSRDKSGEYPLYRIVYFHLRTGGIKYGFYHDDIISSVALSADGRYALSGSDDTKARLWDLKTGELKYTWPHFSKVAKVQLSPDGQYAMTNSASEGIYIWNTNTGKLIRRLNKIRATVASAVFSSNSKQIATGYSREEIILWDIKSGEKLNSWRPKRRYIWQSSLANVTTLAFEDKNTLISETSRGIMQFWSLSKK
ncbi:MAG: hypothetical protein KZQ64_09330 [gamma proteobacterium symbiont of Bathyaustriella thionipta]|nr:hypothetical protein [gamma proteobacterium symbiont of Bathyaustriella thionipta]MCU7949476.1 hypothetical protein [gamma proteobacterium symbiont of Bathyaustriella thionipta]MCU7953576.1 hypothetical protein [gamma proteobacterium symbiont of Bathyaustriella thionipta]MCU7955932.1 hypothetical protein [gamma proteobacterium symbiont of Bathyaustriella thionipta]MCU7967725.1 hypothetical protein [gamma proteobacterium symbiont of Bathyaustriella thionipta]